MQTRYKDVTSPITVCAYIKEIRRWNLVPVIFENKLAGEPQVQHIHAGKTLGSSRLKDDRFSNWYELIMERIKLPARYIERLGWLEGEPRIVLEIDAGTEFPRQFVDSVNLEHIGRIKIKVVVVPVDVVVGIREIIAVSLIGIASPKHTFLTLDGKASQDLPFVRQPLNCRDYFELVELA
jgi:hypothetical protein